MDKLLITDICFIISKYMLIWKYNVTHEYIIS